MLFDLILAAVSLGSLFVYIVGTSTTFSLYRPAVGEWRCSDHYGHTKDKTPRGICSSACPHTTCQQASFHKEKVCPNQVQARQLAAAKRWTAAILWPFTLWVFVGWGAAGALLKVSGKGISYPVRLGQGIAGLSGRSSGRPDQRRIAELEAELGLGE